MSKVIIKQLTNPDNNLPKLYVGSKIYASPKAGRDGKVITGVDENAFEISQIEDDKERKKKIEAIKKEREYLERMLSKNLAPDSSFWDTFWLVLEDEERTLDEANPLDLLHIRFLVANKYVAPSKEAIYDNDEYSACIFYLMTKEGEKTKKVSSEKKKDKAISELFDLSEKNGNKLKLLAAYKFGFNVNNISIDDAYLKFKESFSVPDATDRRRNIEDFISLCEKNMDELSAKVYLDQGMKRKIVRKVGGSIRREDEIYGKDVDEAVAYLIAPENSVELKTLIELLEN